MPTLQLLKLWVLEEKKTINHRINMGMMPPTEARVKMELLEKLTYTFQLDKLEIDIKYHNKI